MRKSWLAGRLTTRTSIRLAPSAHVPLCPCSVSRLLILDPGVRSRASDVGGTGKWWSRTDPVLFPCSVPRPQSVLAGESGSKDAPVPGGPGPVLSDRRLCLALDEPQLCNGHMGVRLGKKSMKWGLYYLLRGSQGVPGKWALRTRGMQEALGLADSLRGKPLVVGL